MGLTAALDLDVSTDGERNAIVSTSAISIDPHLGIEAGLNDMIYLRAGIGNVQEIEETPGKFKTVVQPNFGVGIRLNSITIDYALTNIGDAGVGIHSNVFSLRFDIFKKNM